MQADEMPEQTTNPTNVSDRENGKSGTSALDWPHFTNLERASQVLPHLHAPGAWTVARDRWERLVTSIYIPAPPEVVWSALTEPAALKLWLAVCHGSLAQLDR